MYEHHEKFEPFPTFPLALSFMAEADGRSVGIRPFPPESMMNTLDDGRNCGILPKEFLKDHADVDEISKLPILHMSQSLVMHDTMKLNAQTVQRVIDPPTQVHLKSSVVAVKPRSIGAFVTSETKYYHNGRCIATAQMVALLLGLDPECVVQLKAPVSKAKHSAVESPTNKTDSKREVSEQHSGKTTVFRYRIQSNAALLYRLSGDYNRIHVEKNLLGEDSDPKGGGALLHGLCTMGYAVRAVLHYVHNQ